MTKAQKVSRMRIVLMVALALGLAGVCAAAGGPEKSGKAGKDAPEKAVTKATDAASTVSQPKDDQLRDDPDLSKEERIRRHTLRMQKILAEAETRAAEELRQWQARLKDASSGSPDVVRQQLGEIRKEIEKQLADLDTSLPKQRARVAEAEKKAKALPTEKGDPSLPDEERLRRQQVRLPTPPVMFAPQIDQSTLDSLVKQRERAEERLKEVDARLAKLPSAAARKSAAPAKETLAKDDQSDTQTKMAEEALAAWQLSDEDLRDEPNLTRGERSLRHTVRRQRAQIENLSRDTQQRKQAMEEQQREFEAKLKEAASAPADVARRRLEALRTAGQKHIADSDSSLTKQTALLKTAEEKLQGIPNEDVRDDPNLPSEERKRRHLLRLERADAENSIRLGRDRIEQMRGQRLMAATEVGQVDARLAELGEEVAQPAGASEKATKSTAAAAKASTRGKTSGVAIAPSKPLRPPRMGVLGFLRDRVLDLCDLFRFRLHVPDGFRGIGAKARGTLLAQAGFIYFDGKSVGNDRRGAGIWRESRLEGGVGPGYFSRVSDEMTAGNRYTDVHRPWSRLYHRGIVRNGAFWDDGRLHPLSCGAEVQFFILGVEFEAYPLEALDFAIGWFGLDPFNDDESRIQRTWYEWQTVPELKVRDEWQEKPMPPPKKYYLPLEKKAAPPVEEKPLSEEKPAEEKGK